MVQWEWVSVHVNVMELSGMCDVGVIGLSLACDIVFCIIL